MSTSLISEMVRHKAFMRGVCSNAGRRRLGRALRDDEIDDMMQLAFIQVWRAEVRGTYRETEGSSARAYLTTITARTVMREAGKCWHDAACIDDVDIESDEPSPEKLAMKSEMRAALERLVSMLTPIQQEALHAQARDRELKSMALERGLGEANIRQRAERAIRRLRQLAECEPAISRGSIEVVA